MTSHKKTGTKEYAIWKRMKAICSIPSAAGYKKYGGSGIQVDPLWKDSFPIFLQEMGDMPEGCTGIELIDPTKDFQKHNCRWVGWKTRKKKEYRLQDQVVASFAMDKEHYKFLMSQVFAKQKELGRRYTFSEFMREMVRKSAPMPRTMDMFGKDNRKKV